MTKRCLILAAAIAAAGTTTLAAQENFYRVYQYETPLAGWAEPALWTTFVPRSDENYRSFRTTRAREGLWAHSAELEFGATDHVSLALYGDFEDPAGAGSRLTQTRLEARYRFGQAYEHVFDYGFDVEYYLPRSAHEKPQQAEFRGVIQKDLGDFRLVLNPVLNVDITGADAGGSPDVSLQTGVYYRRSPRLQPGLEFYADFGRTAKWEDQRFVAMPVVDLLLGRHWVWQLGAGRRVGGRGDDWVVESILRFQFNAVRPTRWFGLR